MNIKELETLFYEFGHVCYTLGRMETDEKTAMKEYNKYSKSKEDLMKSFEEFLKKEKQIKKVVA